MKANVNGVEINYEVSGNPDKPWLTFSNSLATNLHMWDEQARVLSWGEETLPLAGEGTGGHQHHGGRQRNAERSEKQRAPQQCIAVVEQVPFKMFEMCCK